MTPKPPRCDTCGRPIRPWQRCDVGHIGFNRNPPPAVWHTKCGPPVPPTPVATFRPIPPREDQ